MNKYYVLYDVNFSDGFYDRIEEEFDNYFKALELYQNLISNTEISNVHILLRTNEKEIIIC